MSDPFLGEIKVISWNFPPKGWSFCNGQLLSISQNQALFSILGTTYGGDGRVSFGLPNLQGRSPIHVGNGITLGEMGGETAHTLNYLELPSHLHVPAGTTTAANTTPLDSPNAALPAGAPQYVAGTPNTSLQPQTVHAVGGNQPHENLSPYLVLNFIIALQGIFPSRN